MYLKGSSVQVCNRNPLWKHLHVVDLPNSRLLPIELVHFRNVNLVHLIEEGSSCLLGTTSVYCHEVCIDKTILESGDSYLSDGSVQARSSDREAPQAECFAAEHRDNITVVHFL